LRLPSGSLSSLNRRLLQMPVEMRSDRTPTTEHPHKLTKRFVKELNPTRADRQVYTLSQECQASSAQHVGCEQ
jgi:hypothetical protein